LPLLTIWWFQIRLDRTQLKTLAQACGNEMQNSNCTWKREEGSLGEEYRDGTNAGVGGA
jgi:hypothetical protein